MQQLAVYLFTERSLYILRVSSHPPSGVHKTVTAASGTGHIIGATTSFKRGQVRPRWNDVAAPMIRPVPEAAVTVLCTPDDGCDDTRNT